MYEFGFTTGTLYTGFAALGLEQHRKPSIVIIRCLQTWNTGIHPPACLDYSGSHQSLMPYHVSWSSATNVSFPLKQPRPMWTFPPILTHPDLFCCASRVWPWNKLSTCCHCPPFSKEAITALRPWLYAVEKNVGWKWMKLSWVYLSADCAAHSYPISPMKSAS